MFDFEVKMALQIIILTVGFSGLAVMASHRHRPPFTEPWWHLSVDLQAKI